MRSRRNRRYRRRKNTTFDNFYDWLCSLFMRRRPRRKKIIFQENYIELIYPEEDEEIFVNRPQQEDSGVIDGVAYFMGEYKELEQGDQEQEKRI